MLEFIIGICFISLKKNYFVVCVHASPLTAKLCNVIVIIFLKTTIVCLASNGGGMGSVSSSQLSYANQSPVGVPSSHLTASSDCSKNSTDEINFQTVHEKFGREIEQDLKERRRLKELAQQPLIQL